MVRLEYFLFGYRRVKVDDIPKAANLLLKLGLSAEISENGEFILRERDVKRFWGFARGRIRFEMGERRGVTGFLCENRKRYGVFAAVIALIMIGIFLSDRVWDVRVNGNTRLSDTEVTEMLSDHGISVGASWRRMNKNEAEISLLAENEDIAWISVNRRGTVAYVEIVESENTGIPEPPEYLYSNIVADRDGVVEDISVRRGTAAVKKGDTVRCGDILISGIADTDRGTVFSRAEGSVILVSSKTVTVEVAGKYTDKHYEKEKISEISVKIFEKEINIFKNYRKTPSECDIIKRNEQITLFGKYKLPITVTKTYKRIYTVTEMSYSESELAARAAELMQSRLAALFRDSKVTSLKSSGKFTGSGYTLTTVAIYSASVGEERKIDIGSLPK